MRYIVGLLLGIGLIVLTFVLIFKAFGGHSSTPKPQSLNLNDYANTDMVVRYTIDGPITSDQTHNRIRITVSKDQVVYEQVKGYEGKLVQTKTYENNPDAFATYLHALSLASYTKGNKQITDDERGHCPQGSRYVYEAINGGDTLMRWWSTTCGSKQSNFLGSPSTVRYLFQKQVPDYSKLTTGLNLY